MIILFAVFVERRNNKKECMTEENQLKSTFILADFFLLNAASKKRHSEGEFSRKKNAANHRRHSKQPRQA